MSEFSARPSALGYLYQIRYALYVILASENDNLNLHIEALDDINLDIDGTPTELLQLKHNSLNRVANLTDTSPDFWKTIRVWSSAVTSGSLADDTILTLVTTASVPNTSILSKFHPRTASTDIAQTESRLLEIAASSTNKSLENAFSTFKSLTTPQRLRLLGAIRILDENPDISDIQDRIKNRLNVPKLFKENIFNQVEGWWFKRVIEQMNSINNVSITKEEVIDSIWRIQKQYEDDNLPTEFWEEIPIPPEDETDQMTFVRQLREIALQKPQINKAIKDYYQAFEQRSRWQRENLLYPGELQSYEEELVDEWERQKYWQEYDEHDDDSLIEAGRTIFRWVDEAKDFPKIRPKVEAPYVVRGSFHILANETKPRVWWHPLFLERLQSIIEVSDPQAAWQQRPTEVANLLNPAFCSLLLRDAIKAYQQTNTKGLPYTLLFLILPVVLHKATRIVLPRTKTTKMNSWISENPSVLIGFPERVIGLKIITKEAIYYGLQKEVFSQNADAMFSPTSKTFRKSKDLKNRLAQLDQTEIEEIQNKARFIGRWFATMPSEATIYAMWGIKP